MEVGQLAHRYNKHSGKCWYYIYLEGTKYLLLNWGDRHDRGLLFVEFDADRPEMLPEVTDDPSVASALKKIAEVLNESG